MSKLEVSDAEIKAFRLKYREIFPGSHPDRQTIIELLTASKEAVRAGSEAFRRALSAASPTKGGESAGEPSEAVIRKMRDEEWPDRQALLDEAVELLDCANDEHEQTNGRFPDDDPHWSVNARRLITKIKESRD